VAINIKDPETDRLARELAALTGQPLTAAVREAIVERLAVLRRRKVIDRSSDLADIITRGRHRRVADDRSEAEILGYGSDGLPG
jgi:antitoxin VapB